jgi:hypothetical protein
MRYQREPVTYWHEFVQVERWLLNMRVRERTGRT